MINIRICHTISSLDKNAGGTSTYLQLLSNELVKYINLSIVSIFSSQQVSIDSRVHKYIVSATLPKFHGYSYKLENILKCIDSDLYHGNGLWQYPVHIMSKIAKKKKMPYIISPHGMLEPWALNSGRWKKKLALWLYQKSDLAKASCIHVTSQKESDHIREFGYKNPIAIIPNGINLLEFALPKRKPTKGKLTILFLSRIHPIKGIELLIEAWAKIDISLRLNWQINIAGNGNSSYIAKLQKMISNKNLENEIHIIGPQFGKDKLITYHLADLFVLPTYSENFGIVVAEALASGVPVITTKGAPWEELSTRNAGWWIDRGVDELVEALHKAMQLSSEERQLMGQNGCKLVEENYSIGSTAKKMTQLYSWILKGGERPEFVNLYNN